MFARIDHVGVAVEDLDAGIALYEKTYEMTLVHRETVTEQGVEAVLASLRDAGVRLLDETPRTGIRNSRVAFLHPKSSGGVLTEIVQPAEDH